jgi:hypothetical protein
LGRGVSASPEIKAIAENAARRGVELGVGQTAAPFREQYKLLAPVAVIDELLDDPRVFQASKKMVDAHRVRRLRSRTGGSPL